MQRSPKPSVLHSAALVGVEAAVVSVETTLRGQGATPRLTGSVDPVVREAYHRVLHAFQACGLPMPRGVPLIHFGPADVKKDGSGFDLPMALSLAMAAGLVTRRVRAAAFGEVALDGSVRPCPGIVAAALALAADGFEELYCSTEDAALGAAVPGLRCLPVADLASAVNALQSGDLPEAPRRSATSVLIRRTTLRRAQDLSELEGLESAKLALAAAVAGRHDLLFVGPPGCGKSALLRCSEDLLTEPDETESLDILRIHSARSFRGLGDGALGVSRSGRPVRAPHCSSSAASLLGGGPLVRPGEVTLAHRGLLILDELPEFRREALEGLRQPLEERQVSIARARRTVTFPADFQILAAMNPCPCGQLGRTGVACRCTPMARTRYRARLSGPLLDRFDLRVSLEAIPAEQLGRGREASGRGDDAPEGGTRDWAARIRDATDRQRERNPERRPNGRLEGAELEAVAGADSSIHAWARRAVQAFGLSARGRLRVLRVARTLADLDQRENIEERDVLTAARLRTALSD